MGCWLATVIVVGLLTRGFVARGQGWILQEDVRERLQQALVEEAQGVVWQAEELARSIDPTVVSVHEWASFVATRSLLRQGLWRQGSEALATLLVEAPLSSLRPWILQWAGIAAFHLQQYEEALRWWDSALAGFRSIPDTTLQLSVMSTVEYWYFLALLHLGQYRRADTLAARYVQQYPSSQFADDVLLFWAFLAELEQQYRQAAQRLQLLRQTYPCHTATLTAFAREAYVRLILREFAQALELTEGLQLLIERLRRGEPVRQGCEPFRSFEVQEQELLYVRAEAYLQREQWEAAQQYFDELLRRYPQGFLADRARFQKAWIDLRRGKSEEALQQLKALRGSSDRLVTSLARLYVPSALKALGDTAAARQELLELSLQRDFPYPARVLLELGQLSYEAAQYRNARLQLEQALREATDAVTTLQILVLLGSVYQQLEQWEQALRTFRTAEQMLQQADTLLVPRWRAYRERALLGAATSLLMLHRPGEAIAPLERLVGEDLAAALQPDEILFWLAEAYYRVGQIERALQTFERVLLRYPQSPRREEALYGTAWCAFRMQQMERAAFWFERLLSEFPQTRYAPEAYVRRADALYLLRQYRQAATVYWELAQRFPKTPEGEYAAYQYGYVLYRLRDYAAAERAFRYFARTYPTSSLADEALYFLGWLAFQQQQYGEAVERFRNLLQSYPNSPLAARTWFAIGNAYYNMEQWHEALQAYRTVVERYPSSPYAVEAVKSVQYCLLALGQTEEAYRWADSIAQRYPATRLEEEARLKRAELLFTQRQYGAALQEYRDFAQRYPYSERTPEALYWAFRSALALGELEAARRFSEQLQQNYPQLRYAAQTLLELAHEEARRDPVVADRLYQRVEQKGDSVQRAEAVFRRGTLAYVRGDTMAALGFWHRAIAEYPTTEVSAQARYQVALYWRSRERYDSVRSYLTPLALRSDDLGAEALYYVGEAWMREGRCDSAVIAFRQLQTSHQGKENWYSLSLLQAGECYEQMRNPQAAMELYRVLLTLRPNDEYGRIARSRLNRMQRRNP
ncbi:MAG: tetratricopeptide repeat protein [Candidatus Kapabacteria bacterium]|nr:tetratricopeptide repeat protein [Candidatus Kapabacteria bacterium]